MRTSESEDRRPVQPWRPRWRLPRAIDPGSRISPEGWDALRVLDRIHNVLDLCRLVGLSAAGRPVRLAPGCGDDLFDPWPAIERLERYRSAPAPESAEAAREAIIQFIRTLPVTDPAAVPEWEANFRRCDMADFIPDLVEGGSG